MAAQDWRPWEWTADVLEDLEAASLLRDRCTRESPQDPQMIAIDGQSLINFSSNDYLGLATDPRLATAAADAATERGWGSGASPLITGRGQLHASLENRLAEFEGTEAALLFPSGYAANLGAVTALADKSDLILSDAKNHASIIDGCRLSGAEVVVYPHADIESVDRTLATKSKGSRRSLIVTDSLFSMDGCLAPLPALAEVASKRGAMLLVDEAHATGVLGENGRGACELAGLEDAPIVRVGTLSKAAGSIGGFVAGPRTVIDLLWNRARPQFFSTAMPEPAAAASLAALDIFDSEPHRRHVLLDEARRLRAALRSQGWSVPNDPTQIVPVMLGSPRAALHCAQRLRDCGILAPPIRPPSVPVGESLLRVSVSYAHAGATIDRLIEAMAQVSVERRE